VTESKTLVASSLASSRFVIPKGFVTVAASTVALLVVSAIFAHSSVSHGAIVGMLPFAAVLAIVGLGQMLVVQQGGIDLSSPGAISLAIVIVSHQPDGDDSKLRLNAIIATLGMNALLYGMVLNISGGTPRTTTRLLASIAGGTSLGIPNAVFFAVGALLIVVVMVKKTVVGRRFEAVGANPDAARVLGLRSWLHRSSAYVWAQLLYCLAGILLAGITRQPTAYEGDSYLLPSVAVVVLGGTSLLGGRGFPVATAVAALFLTQLGQFVLALGVPNAVQILVQAAALAVGVGIYTVDWVSVRTWLTRGLSAASVATS